MSMPEIMNGEPTKEVVLKEENKVVSENNLFPVFLKLENLRLLIVGGGHVGLEKLTTVLQNAPKTPIKLVSETITPEIKSLASKHPNIELIERPYQSSDIDNIDIIISAVNRKEVSAYIRDDAKEKGILINVADTPNLC